VLRFHDLRSYKLSTILLKISILTTLHTCISFRQAKTQSFQFSNEEMTLSIQGRKKMNDRLIQGQAKIRWSSRYKISVSR